MASTLAQMRSRIADDINRSDLNTQIDKAINRAIEYYTKKRNFWFTETTGTFSTIASQEAYGTADSIPTDIQRIDYLKITISSTDHQSLIKKTFGWIQENNEGRSTGNPDFWAWYQNKFYFSLIPNAVKTITVFYNKSYSAMTLDADTNDFTTYAEDLIESRARWWIELRILKNTEAATTSKAEELDALSALDAIDDEKKSTNLIEPIYF